MDRPLLGSGLIDRLQAAFMEGAPLWSSRLHVSGVGLWPARGRVDVEAPGSLDEVLRSHLPGGSRIPPTVGRQGRSFDDTVRIGGADRGANATLGVAASLHGAYFDRQADYVFIETTKPTIDGFEPAAWIEPLFRALCRELQPAIGTASSMGERMAQGREFGHGSLHLGWLTFFGKAAIDNLPVATLEGIAGLTIEPLGEGFLLTLGAAPAARTYKRYIELLRATETAIGPRHVVSALERRSSVYGHFPKPEPEPQKPTPIGPVVRRPEAFVDDAGVEHIRGDRYEGVRLQFVDYRRPGAVLEGFEAVRCEFDHCGLGPFKSDVVPLIVRNSHLQRCRISQLSLHFVRFEDCTVDGLRGSMSYLTQGPLLRHVVVRGPVDALYLLSPGRTKSDLRAIARHKDFYETVDWALDISEARLARCDISGVPGHLVRRDPATQILITRERALATEWTAVAAHTPEYYGIERLLKSPMDSGVLVACPRDKDFDRTLATFARLREAGIAEPD